MATNPQDRIDELEQALWRIVQWSEAYPVKVFPEPDLAKAADVLKANGLSLTVINASMARDVLQGVGKIAREALKARNGGRLAQTISSVRNRSIRDSDPSGRDRSPSRFHVATRARRRAPIYQGAQTCRFPTSLACKLRA